MTTGNVTVATTPELQLAIVAPEGTPPPTTRRTADGGVQFQNANYRITAGDAGEVLIENLRTGESYRVHGDPHVDVDGTHAFDFWGRTTFVLEDGTLVTLSTTVVLSPSLFEAGALGLTLTSRVDIASGEYAVAILGVDGDRIGDLEFFEGVNGVHGGNVLVENARGAGFVSIDGEGGIAVDQAYIDVTDVTRTGENLLMRWYGEIMNVFGSVATILVEGQLGPHRPEARREDDTHAPHPEPRYAPRPEPRAQTDIAFTFVRSAA